MITQRTAQNSTRGFISNKSKSETPNLIKSGLVGIIILSIIALFGAYGLYNYQISKPQNKSGTKAITIDQGENRDQIAQKLFNQEIIDNPRWFGLYLRISKRTSSIKAGNHPINSNSNIKTIVDELTSTPQTDQVWVTIPEGLRADEIGDAIELAFSKVEDSKFVRSDFDQIVSNPSNAKLSSEANDFLDLHLPTNKPLEGFLYPDTYSFEAESTAEILISKMIETLKTRIESNQIDTSDQLGSLYDNLIVASMLEREAFNNDEAAMITNIIHRRLDQNYPLGIDATSLYVLKDWKAPLTNKELSDPNPYNTRLKTGLPPTPIANPGIETIIAAYNPKPNEYLYYLHGKDGRIYYAKTNAEHESNKRYL